MYVVDCPSCGAKAGIGANTDQLIEQKINKTCLVQGHCSECGTTKTISVIDSQYKETKVLPMYWIDEDELLDTPEHEHDYQHPYRRFTESGVIVVRTCIICGREKHTRFGKQPRTPVMVSDFQNKLFRVYGIAG